MDPDEAETATAQDYFKLLSDLGVQTYFAPYSAKSQLAYFLQSNFVHHVVGDITCLMTMPEVILSIKD
jgi:hypothetical protein